MIGCSDHMGNKLQYNSEDYLLLMSQQGAFT